MKTDNVRLNGTTMIEEGWSILRGGKPWDGTVYSTKEAAETTARQCIAGDYELAPARNVADYRVFGRQLLSPLRPIYQIGKQNR